MRASAASWRVEVDAAGGVEQIATARPELQQEVVDGVMSVGEGGEDGAVEAARRLMEEAGDAMEVVPGRGQAPGRS